MEIKAQNTLDTATLTEINTKQTSLEKHRQQFPALAHKAYFNYGGQGPMPQASLKAIEQAYGYIQQAGPFTGKTNVWIVEEANKTRSAIASELGAPVETITLTEDVTIGCNIALWGTLWQAGDHILLSDCEHPGVVAAVREISRRFNVEVSIYPLMATLNEGDSVATTLEHLRPNTRMIVLSHVLWNTGQILPLAELSQAVRSHSTGKEPVRILVDAAQSVGLLPLNLTELGADFYAFTGHKWWCGPEGLGGLYVRPEAFESLYPTFIGWRSIFPSYLPKAGEWLPDGRRFEVATSAYPLYGGLREAIAVHHQWGTIESRFDRIRQLSQYLWERLSQLPNITCLRTLPPETGLVSFQLKEEGKHSQLVKFLEQQGFMLRTILSPNCVRACVHYFTLESEIDQLVTVIKEFKG